MALDDANDWTKAIRIFETRVRRRFIDPVDMLIAHEIGQERGTFGFAILAIDCLLVETLQRFREGQIRKGENGRLIRTFLSERFATDFDDGADKKSKADTFYENCRCALHHSGQTDGDFRVKRSGRLIQFNDDASVVVNRTAFHEALEREFEAYLIELADSANADIRKNFRTRMNAICGTAKEASP